MERILLVVYRPNAGQRSEVLRLLNAQHQRASEMGFLQFNRRWLGEATHGEIVVFLALGAGKHVDALWEDDIFRELDAELASVARIVPMRSLGEASATYMDLAAAALTLDDEAAR